MSSEQMRAKLLQKYTGSKKIANMSDKQIHATYMRLLSKGKL